MEDLLKNKVNANHITIFNGKFAIRVEPGTPGATSRTNKMGKDVSEKYFDCIEGMILRMTVNDTQYGKQLDIKLKGPKSEAILHLQFGSMNALRMIGSLHAIDLEQAVRIDVKPESYSNTKGETVNTSSIHLSQNGGKWVALEWTKSNPGALPPLKKVKYKGKEVWDNTDRLEWLEEYLTGFEWAAPAEPEHSAVPVPEEKPEKATPPKKAGKVPVEAEAEDDDAPF